MIRQAWLGMVCVAFVLSGCATTSMKGTPFYTGEYERREGPAADRVNLWPALYYRDPALSVLWPLMEFCPDHLAVRPVYSVYGRSENRPVHNVLWPLGRFDLKNQDYRVFPVYWGDEYFNVFPLYWHKNDPFAGNGHNALFPFWIWNSRAKGNSLDVMWPIYASRHYRNSEVWRLWPVYGTRQGASGLYRFYAWPLIRTYSSTEKRGHGVLPFYCHAEDASRTDFISLPYSRSIAAQPGAKSWELALPLWYREWKGDSFDWAAIPALSWGTRNAGMADDWYALGAGHRLVGPERLSHHILPVYYYDRDADSRRFYSLPWWSEKHADGSGWKAAFPFYYGSSSTSGSVAVTPFYARKKRPDDSLAWQCIIPIVYLDNTKDAHFLTPLGGRWRMGEQSSWLALPLLSGGAHDADSGRNLWLAGLAGQEWDKTGKSRYVFPFYYSAPEKGAFVSLPYAAWRTGNRQNHALPMLLSAWQEDGDASESLWLGGLGHWKKKRGEARYSHVLPFYLWSRGDYFYTALYGKDREASYYATPLAGRYNAEGESSGSWIFPLYRHKSSASGRVDVGYLLLGHSDRDDHRVDHGFFGLYNYRRWKSYRQDGDRRELANEGRDISCFLWLGKLRERWGYDATESNRAGEPSFHRKKQSFFPLWKKTLSERVAAGTRSESSSVLGPLYDTRHETKTGEKEHDYLRRRILWRLYHCEKLNGDSSTDVFPGIAVDSHANGYRKYSVFWRLFRYEKDPKSGNRKLDLLFIPFVR